MYLKTQIEIGSAAYQIGLERILDVLFSYGAQNAIQKLEVNGKNSTHQEDLTMNNMKKI